MILGSASETITVESVSWESHEAALREIRVPVFIEEQQCPVEEEFDGLDSSCHHLLALVGGEVAGCARVTPGGKIERMAVLQRFRKRGVALALMAAAVPLARRLAAGGEVILHAQTYAVPLYAKFGFQVCSEQFEEAGIPHVKMRLASPL